MKKKGRTKAGNHKLFFLNGGCLINDCWGGKTKHGSFDKNFLAINYVYQEPMIKTTLTYTDACHESEFTPRKKRAREKKTKTTNNTHRTQDSYIDIGRMSDEEELGRELVRLLPAPWVSKES